MRVKYDLERQTFSQFVGKSEYPSPKWLKMKQSNKDDYKWQWRPLTAVWGHSCNFYITQKESSSDAVVKQDSEMPGPQFHTILKSTTLFKVSWGEDISLSAEKSILKKQKV